MCLSLSPICFSVIYVHLYHFLFLSHFLSWVLLAIFIFFYPSSLAFSNIPSKYHNSFFPVPANTTQSLSLSITRGFACLLVSSESYAILSGKQVRSGIITSIFQMWRKRIILPNLQRILIMNAILLILIIDIQRRISG